MCQYKNNFFSKHFPTFSGETSLQINGYQNNEDPVFPNSFEIAGLVFQRVLCSGQNLLKRKKTIFEIAVVPSRNYIVIMKISTNDSHKELMQPKICNIFDAAEIDRNLI